MMMGRKKVASVLVLGGVVTLGAFVGVRAALALSPGVRGGRARTALSVAGTINGGTATGSTVMVEYVFLKGSAEACRVPTVLNRNTSNGHFTGEVDIERCPGDLFDGSDVTVRVEAGGAAVATGAVNPVPYARYAERVGTPDCPTGYERDATATSIVLCRKGLSGGSFDEVVRVGTGASAFWVDRYEASVWQNADGSGAQYGVTTANYPSSFPPNGQWTVPVYSLSRSGVTPSRRLTWFQAQEVCTTSGKRLPTGTEWLRAARLTPDPGASNGTGGTCVTGSSEPNPRNTGGGTSCVSAWGVQDMIGNLWEWTDEWDASVGQVTSPPQTVNGSHVTGISVNGLLTPWPSDYGGDMTSNITSTVTNNEVAGVIGVPSAAIRGGYWSLGGNLAGIFALDLGRGPSHSGQDIGFRCVIPR